MDRKIFSCLMVICSVLCCSNQALGTGKPVFDAANYANLVKQLEASRQQIGQLNTQIQELQRLSNAIENPNRMTQMMFHDMTGPISSDINQLNGFRNDFSRILQIDQRDGSSKPMPSVSLRSVGTSNKFVRENFLPTQKTTQSMGGTKGQVVITQKDQIEAYKKKRDAHKEAVVNGVALSWSEKETIEGDLKSLEQLAAKIAQSEDLRTDVQISNQLKVFEIRQLIHLRTLHASLLENVSTMLMGSVE